MSEAQMNIKEKIQEIINRLNALEKNVSDAGAMYPSRLKYVCGTTTTTSTVFNISGKGELVAVILSNISDIDRFTLKVDNKALSYPIVLPLRGFGKSRTSTSTTETNYHLYCWDWIRFSDQVCLYTNPIKFDSSVVLTKSSSTSYTGIKYKAVYYSYD